MTGVKCNPQNDFLHVSQKTSKEKKECQAVPSTGMDWVGADGADGRQNECSLIRICNQICILCLHKCLQVCLHLVGSRTELEMEMACHEHKETADCARVVDSQTLQSGVNGAA